jgi:hypothetical protein
MAITLNGTTGITSTGGYSSDGISFADDTPSNTLVTTTGGNVGIGTATPKVRLAGKTLSINNTDAGVSYQTGIELLNNGASAGELFASDIEMVLNAYYNKDLNFRTNNTVRGTFDTSGNFKFNSGYGSAAIAYGCRAWVNFNGTGTVAIRGSGNVSSITDGGTGQYTVNFTTAMPDTNFAVVDATGQRFIQSEVVTTSSTSIVTRDNTGSLVDTATIYQAIFR